MKKSKKILDKVQYEENPWGNKKTSGTAVRDFLPPPAQMKNATIRYIDDSEYAPLSLATKDMKALRIQAKKAGLSPEAFVIGVVHDFLTGRLIRPNR